MTITTVPAGSHRALPPGLDRNALPDNQAIQRMRAGLEQGIQGGGHGALRTAVTQFRDVFPKLSLWERFKDFFGLSDTTDNRRDAAALCVIGTFYDEGTRRQTMESEAYNRTAMTLAQILQEIGLAPERGHIELEGLTADITARLLAQTRDPEGVITLAGGEMTTTPGNGDVVLTGQVSFGNAANTPELLRNLSLPFVATVISPLDMIANLMGGEEDGTTLRTLFGALEPETRIALQRQYEQNEGSRQVLFSRDGVLGELSQPEVLKTASSPGQPSVPAEWTEHNRGFVGFVCEFGAEFVQSGLEAVEGVLPENVTDIKDQEELLAAALCSQTQVENFNTASGIKMEGCEFNHKLQNTPEKCLLIDIHRGGLSNATVVVDGYILSPQTTRAMQSVALAADNREDNIAVDLIMREVGEAWTRLIRINPKLDESAAQNAAAAIMYACCQSGAGRGCLGFMSIGPHYDPATHPVSQDVLHIDTQRGGDGTSVTQAAFSSGLRQVGFFGREAPGSSLVPDFRASGVSYTLPASTAQTAAEMAAGFLQKNIGVEGFGVRYPKATSLEALKPLPSPEGWSRPSVLTPGQQATLDTVNRAQRDAGE